ncbi:cytochrome P450 78A3 [Cordyceps javanica]|uniref:Cytochrome P450 78A3 n=1 Tax=Cordyceps javanica TaxID=43265 RepID=A0A545VB53_9HYPO|nr:cytochrome P450 78A3 [Cordyceps javanica]TQW10150.1 cytochrome P450 78A3 [Cordyceps javanica]
MARQWYSENDDDGLLRVLWHGNQEFIFVRSQQALAEILVKNCYQFEKPGFIRNFLSIVVGWALLTTEGDVHKKQRRNMLPAFAFRHIKDLYPLFWKKSCEGIAAMTAEYRETYQPSTGKAEMEISAWSTRSGLDIIGLASTSIDFGAIKDADSPLAQSYYRLNPSPSDFFLIGLSAFLPRWVLQAVPLPRMLSIKRATKHIRGVCRGLIKDKGMRLANKEDIGVDILSVALSSGLFTDEDLVDQMLTFLTAGHETTAASLVWAIYLLAKNPHMQERLRTEIRENLPSPDSADSGITSADIDGLPYLNAVCNETLRTHGPVATTIRIATANTTLQGQYIPRGTLLMLPIWAHNTDRLLWGADAHEFKPERWLSPQLGGTSKTNSASGGATSNYAFMTFLHGPHSCIGANFSKSEMACLLAAWIGRFSFEIKDKSLLDERNLRINPSVVAKPEGGLRLR